MKYTTYIYLFMFLTAPLIGSQSGTTQVLNPTKPPRYSKIFAQVLQEIETQKATAQEEKKKAAAQSQQQAKKTADQDLKRMQELIRKSTLSLHHWQVKPPISYEDLWQFYRDNQDIEPMATDLHKFSNCPRSANFILEYIAQASEDKVSRFFQAAYYLVEPNTDRSKTPEPTNGFHGSLKDFTATTQSGYTNKTMQAICSLAQEAEHVIYAMTIHVNEDNPLYHCLTLEKKSDGKATWWRLLQSSHKDYTLAEWIGADAWDEADIYKEAHNELFKKYGLGKQLNQQEVQQLLENLSSTFPPFDRYQHNAELWVYVETFNVQKATS